MDPSRHRKLLPATEKEDPPQPPPPPGQTPGQQKGKSLSRISTACETCKKRKSRCSGLPAPCSLCRALGTECIIDESRDQRRNRSSTTQLMASSTAQGEFSASLIQSLRYSELAEVEELIGAIRNNLPSDHVASILERNVGSLQDRGALKPVAITDLQIAFSKLQPSPVEEEEISPTVDYGQRQASEGSQGAEVEQVEEAFQGHWRTPPGQQQRPTLSNQLKTYQRWLNLFGTWPNVLADRQLENAPGSSESRTTDWDQGLWRKMAEIQLSPTGGSQISGHSTEEDPKEIRTDWHPALQIHPAAEESPGPPINLIPTEMTRLAEVTDLIAAQESGETGGWVEIMRSVPGPYHRASANADFESYQFTPTRYPLHSVQTLTAIEDSPLSRFITDYREAARASILYGIAPIDITGHDGVEVDLFFRERSSEDGYTVGNWASELWRSFHDWDVFVRLAMCLSMTYVMRWMLIPTAKRYADVPDILKPRPIQRIVAHHAAIDFLPLPDLRERLIKQLQDFMTALPAAKLSVNWPGDFNTAVTREQSLGCLRLTEAFEKHVVDSNNWSIGESILKTFPDLKGTIRLDQGH